MPCPYVSTWNIWPSFIFTAFTATNDAGAVARLAEIGKHECPPVEMARWGGRKRVLEFLARAESIFRSGFIVNRTVAPRDRAGLRLL